MLIGIGTDIVDVERIKNAAEKYGSRFVDRIFTKTEQEYCNSFKEGKFQHYAARFAAKEAFSKAIGTGIARGFKFNEIGVVNDSSGEPYLVLTGATADKWGHAKTHISLSHTSSLAIAVITLEEIDSVERKSEQDVINDG